jgi:ABC-type sugar transport system permease subunit
MDLLNIVRTTLMASAVLALFILVNYRFRGFPRSIFILDWILSFILAGGVRAAILVDELFSITRNYDCSSIKHKLQELIPDYTPQL